MVEGGNEKRKLSHGALQTHTESAHVGRARAGRAVELEPAVAGMARIVPPEPIPATKGRF